MTIKQMCELALKSYPCRSDLLDALNYCPLSGEFRWAKSFSNRVSVGDIAGSIYEKKGKKYRVIRINKKLYKASTIAWICFYGNTPKYFIDHKNGNGLDNSIDNLRESSPADNQKNLRKYSSNTSGYAGVNKKRNKWQASITKDKVTFRLGCFDTKDEAALVRIYAQERMGFFAGHGAERPL